MIITQSCSRPTTKRRKKKKKTKTKTKATEVAEAIKVTEKLYSQYTNLQKLSLPITTTPTYSEILMLQKVL